jgi:HlyD family secretion protein
MKIKMSLYIGIAVVLIAGGSLLAAKGKDAVSQAESRKQGVLEAEQKIIVNDKSPGTANVQSTTFFTDLYIQEGQIGKLKINQSVKVHFPYLNRPIKVDGVVVSIAAAPQFASLRMTRERGQADLSMFLVRISVDSNTDLLPGMTAEVNLDEIAD